MDEEIQRQVTRSDYSVRPRRHRYGNTPIHRFPNRVKQYANRQALAFVETSLVGTRECTQDLTNIPVARLNAKFEMQYTVKQKDKILGLQTKFDDGQLDEERMMRNLVYWYVNLFQQSSGTVTVSGQAPNEASYSHPVLNRPED